MDSPTEDHLIWHADGTPRLVLVGDRKEYRLGLAFWLVDGYKPAGYPFGKTVKGLTLWVRFRQCRTTVN